ncbi:MULTISPECIES: hypothetical protein [unclassified Cupriavidus]|uniref:hypothetical protein n=1 Tax=unclassified Cupriavidus TaxID=2640874 RepID=UPI0010F7F0A9|nr:MULTISPECIES: hypothetical protein [unclassified Cupriavidus]MWL86957.1 hypothetical protein [Cupriavidus sp. SW-Y-13]
MKYPILAVLASAVVVAGCATSPYIPPPTPETRAVGQSKLAPKEAAQCIGSQWANSSRQQVWMQYMLANDGAYDVYVPGQNPPSGSAAIVRRSPTGQGSWLGFRGSDSAAAGALNQCM